MDDKPRGKRVEPRIDYNGSMPMNLKISELVPYEIALVKGRLEKAKQDVQGSGYVGSVPVFKLRGHWFVRNSTHHVSAALSEGYQELPCHDAGCPADVKEVLRLMDHHLSLKGFAELPVVASDSKRQALLEKMRKEQDDAEKLEILRKAIGNKSKKS